MCHEAQNSTSQVQAQSSGTKQNGELHHHSFPADTTHKAFTGLTLVYPTLAAAVGDIGLGLVGAGGTGITLRATRQIHLGVSTVAGEAVAGDSPLSTNAL